MQLIRTAGTVFGALAMLGAVVPAASARPAEVEWRADIDLEGWGQQLVVDPGSGDVLALLQPDKGSEVLRRLDARTGAVEWTVPVPGMSHHEVDPSTGHVVLGGMRDSRQVLVLVSAEGQVVREVVTDVSADLIELVVDQVSGQVCTFGSQRVSRDSRTWDTACWTSAGDAVFADQRAMPSGRSVPSALAIDPQSHRVYAGGTIRTPGERGRVDGVVLLAYDASGVLQWEARRRTVTPSGDLQVALDPDRGRIHLVNRPGLIQSPVSLISFDDRGRRTSTRSWEDLASVYQAAVAVTSRGRVLTAATEVAHATLRTYSPSGRLLRSAVVRIAPNPRRAYHDQVVIDSRRERVHVLAGGGDTPSRVHTYDFRGRRLSSVVVDRRNVIEGTLAVDLETGRVFVATSQVQDPGQRVTALRP